MPFKKQKRDNRYNVNLTDTEVDLFSAISKLTGVNVGVILRQMALKQALLTLIVQDSEMDFILEIFIKKMRQRSSFTEQEKQLIKDLPSRLNFASVEATLECLLEGRIEDKLTELMSIDH